MTRGLNNITLLQRIAPVFRGFDVPLIVAVALLACVGLVAMYSSGYDHGTRFVDHARNMMIAATVMFVVAQIPPQRLMELAVPLYTFGVVLLIAVAIFGITKKGARRWINVGVVIQPSEILKIAMPLMLAWWFQKREGQLRPLDFLVAGLLLAVPVGLIMKQPDLGTALLVLAAGISVIFFAGIKWKWILPPLLIGVVGIVLLVIYEPQLCADDVNWRVLHEYQRQRVCTLLDPARDPLGKGFHIIQGMIAIGSGGLLGKGFMQGTQTHLEFIPERTTDFIFAAFSEGVWLAWEHAADWLLHIFNLASHVDCAGSTFIIYAAVGSQRDHDFLYLCLCKHGHGQRNIASCWRPLAFCQLWRNCYGDIGYGTWYFDVCEQIQTSNADVKQT
jgi:rod shape determining protein RodA